MLLMCIASTSRASGAIAVVARPDRTKRVCGGKDCVVSCFEADKLKCRAIVVVVAFTRCVAPQRRRVTRTMPSCASELTAQHNSTILLSALYTGTTAAPNLTRALLHVDNDSPWMITCVPPWSGPHSGCTPTAVDAISGCSDHSGDQRGGWCVARRKGFSIRCENDRECFRCDERRAPLRCRARVVPAASHGTHSDGRRVMRRKHDDHAGAEV